MGGGTMNNDQHHQCLNFTQSVATELDRLWDAVRATDRRFQEYVERQQRQDQLVGVQFDMVRDEVDDLADWAAERFDGRIDAAVGEAALARIEIDRVQERLAELVDQLSLRMTEIEVQVANASPNVAAAIQTERLDDLERAVDELGAVVGSPHPGIALAPPPASLPTPAPATSAGPVPAATRAEPAEGDVVDSMTRLIESMHTATPSSLHREEG